MSALIQAFDEMVALTQLEKEHIEEAFATEELAKNQFWVTAGQYADRIAFIEAGKMRIYYGDAEGIEHTCFFAVENTFTASFTSFLTQTPTHENIVAIETVRLRSIHRDDLDALSALVPKVQIVRRILAENLFIVMEKRIMGLQAKSALFRYENMLENDPQLLQTVPLQYLASFLGITPQHLSRLRKRK
jgi:CRP-like cAMP-binding protein